MSDMIYALLPLGFPTFDEFRKAPQKWRRDPEELFTGIDKGSLTAKRESHKYYWRNYACDSLEQAQRIAKDEGYDAKDLQEQPIRRMKHGSSVDGDTEVHVHLWPIIEYKLMNPKGVVFND